MTPLSGPSTRSPNAGMAGGWEVLFHLRNRGSLQTLAGRAKTERTPSEAQVLFGTARRIDSFGNRILGCEERREDRR